MTSDLNINIFFASLTGVVTAYLALRRGRSPWLWFFIGAFFGILGLFILFFFPNASEESQKKPAIPAIVVVESSPSFVQKEWYYLDPNHTQHGPVAFSVLKGLLSDKKLETHSFVWQEEMSHWKKLCDLPEVLSYLNK